MGCSTTYYGAAAHFTLKRWGLGAASELHRSHVFLVMWFGPLEVAFRVGDDR